MRGISVVEYMVVIFMVLISIAPILSALHLYKTKPEVFLYTCERCSKNTTDTVDIMIYENYDRHHFMICHPCYAPVEKALAK